MRPAAHSLRLRLIIGAVAIAGVAVFASLVAAHGARETARLLAGSAAAQTRIDLLAGLSARVSDYAVVAVEAAGPAVPQAARTARLASRATRVEEAFGQIDRALALSVAAAETDGESAQMREATRSLVIARMRAQFAALDQSVARVQGSPGLRAHLDGFATQFSPLLNEAIAEEQRTRDTARAAVERLRQYMLAASVAAVGLALGLVGLFYLGLVRPLIAQLARIRTAAAGIGAGDFEPALPADRRNELGWVFHEINRMAARLKARQHRVDADSAALNQTIAARTAELSEANDRLSRIDAERRRFFADVGHELRTPLTVILAEAELSLRREIPADEAAGSLAIIHARARRLNRRIDDMLRVARSETGQIELDAHAFDLADAAGDALEDTRPLARRRGVRLAGNLVPTPAHGDRDWCRQVIGGLLENAVRHSAEGAVVEAHSRVEAASGRLTIIDEGTGLAPAEIERVFARFARGSRVASGSGFGVGLALARWVIERQGGAIALASPASRTPEGGSTRGPGAEVTITLPLGAET